MSTQSTGSGGKLLQGTNLSLKLVALPQNITLQNTGLTHSIKSQIYQIEQSLRKTIGEYKVGKIEMIKQLELQKMEDAENESYLPQINTELDGIPQDVLVNAGSAVSLLSKPILLQITEGKTDIPVISAVGVEIQGTTGRICKIKEQALINVQIGEYYHPVIFLIATNISFQCILGMDCMVKHEAMIDIQNKELTLMSEKENIFSKLRRPPMKKIRSTNKYRSKILQNKRHKPI
ncbi:hypothetical protein FQA39_LY05908 [Lamprigera yunnana]|nr:hypothetical protein FQA39_LY05908 [Lamprigera yunnana]